MPELDHSMIQGGHQEWHYIEPPEIAREMHDNLGQQLTALLMLSGRAQRRLRQAGESRCCEDIDRLTEGLKQALDLVRGLSHGLLQQSEISPDGLDRALQHLIEQTQAMTGMVCRLHAVDTPRLKDGWQATQLFRIAQEAVSNVMRHADARHLEIELRVLSGRLLLRIWDDGRGLDAADCPDQSMGLRQLRFRAERLGGRIDIATRKGRGTSVCCLVSLDQISVAPCPIAQRAERAPGSLAGRASA